jgi:hypothetical protein
MKSNLLEDNCMTPYLEDRLEIKSTHVCTSTLELSIIIVLYLMKVSHCKSEPWFISTQWSNEV